VINLQTRLLKKEKQKTEKKFIKRFTTQTRRASSIILQRRKKTKHGLQKLCQMRQYTQRFLSIKPAML